jgi:DNA-binding transcriptional MerR regulator
MASDLWTTGQTSGLTQIPPQTMRRYVQDYREFFSESAQRPTKGRRFTQQDINNLLMIRHLYNSNYSPERIKAALKGEWVPPAKPQYDSMDALTLVETARQQMESAADYAQQARYSAQRSKSAVDGAEHTLRQFREVISARVDQKQHVPAILERLDQLEERIHQLEQRLSSQDQNRKKSLFGFGG